MWRSICYRRTRTHTHAHILQFDGTSHRYESDETVWKQIYTAAVIEKATLNMTKEIDK